MSFPTHSCRLAAPPVAVAAACFAFALAGTVAAAEAKKKDSTAASPRA